MLGDVLLIEDIHRKAAIIIAEHINKIRNGRFVIGVSGESGSGKSELSHCIGKLLVKTYNIPTKIIHSDNYYHVHPKKRLAWRKEKGFTKVGLKEIDWTLINKNIIQFLASEKAEMPCIDIIPDEPDILITDFNKVEILIIDGLYALNAENINLNIFIDLTYHETKKARLVRGKEKIDDFRLKVLNQEHLSVISLKHKTDIIIEKDYSVTIKKSIK